MEFKLKPGDIVIDVATGDIGLLANRYCLFDPPEEFYSDFEISSMPVADLNLWAWDIYWTGPDASEVTGSRYQPYTEEGLINLIKTGTFLLESGLRQ